MGNQKIKIDDELYERTKKYVKLAGYSTVEELVTHLLEKELSSSREDSTDEVIINRLKGLGYM